MDVAHPTDLARAMRGRLSRYAMTAIPTIATMRFVSTAGRQLTWPSLMANAPRWQAVLGRSGLSSGQGSMGPNGETVLVLPVAARVINGGGLSYTDVSLGG
jgi:hypothetical protein